MTDQDVDDVIDAVTTVVRRHSLPEQSHIAASAISQAQAHKA